MDDCNESNIELFVQGRPSTSELIASGFYEFAETSVREALQISLIHKTVVFLSLVISSVFRRISAWTPPGLRSAIKEMCDHQRALSRPYAVFEGLKKWRLVQLFLHMAERILGAVEYAIAPVKVKQSPKPVTGGSSTVDVASMPEELGGLPKLLNIRLLTGSSSTGTPDHRPHSEEITSTPFSCVSSSGSVFDRSSTSLVNDLSPSIAATPERDLRNRMAIKIRTWRQAIRSVNESPQSFPNWSPENDSTIVDSSPTWAAQMWNFLTSWMTTSSRSMADTPNNNSAMRKRKRPSHDDDIAFYLPQNKGQQHIKILGTTTEAEIHTEMRTPTENPTIPGLSTVPAIGNWLTSEDLGRPRHSPKKSEGIDHIALVQRPLTDLDALKSEVRSEDSNSESELYEVVDMEPNANIKGSECSLEPLKSVHIQSETLMQTNL